MVESRCGILCYSCEYREKCGCGGCIETNGHPFYGECSVARCCQNKGFAHCGERFSGHGKAENLGYIFNDEDKDLADKLRTAFSDLYNNGHTNENDVNSIILKITVTNGVIYKYGKKLSINKYCS